MSKRVELSKELQLELGTRYAHIEAKKPKKKPEKNIKVEQRKKREEKRISRL